MPSAPPDFKLRRQARFRHGPSMCRKGVAAAMDDVTAFDTPPVLTLAADLRPRIEAVAKVAAAHADKVDRDARFPGEAFEAARKARLLGLLVPTELGGDGGTVSDAAEACHALGRACASTGMVFAMHQIMVAILVRHGLASAWHRGMLRDIAANQWLLASSTTEGTGGGDLRASACAVQVDGARMSLAKNATVISYGAEADAIVTTARRAPDSCAVRPGAGRSPQEGLSARVAVRLGHARHARHLQRGLRPYRDRRTGTGVAGAIPGHPHPIDDADRASHLERGVDRRRIECGRTGARFHPQHTAQRRAAAARRRASHPRHRVIADAACARRVVAAEVRKHRRPTRGARRPSLSRRR